MYFDRAITERSQWKYSYTGKELFEPAKKELARVQKKETASRQSVAELLQDPKVNARDESITKLEKTIIKLAEDHELLLVLVHEFGRDQERIFHLSPGDVVFLNLTEMPG